MPLDDQTATSKPGTELPASFGDYENRHEGETILVCGCGRSLSLLGEPERFVTIGVNDVGRMFHPDYLVILNTPRQFRGDRFDYVKNSRAGALFTHLHLPVDHPRVVSFHLGSRGGTAPGDGSLPHTRNSPYLAANLARYMGAARIGLIGVDFTHDHFWGDTGRHPLDRETVRINQEYRRLAEAFAAAGIELVNLSPFSRLDSLPYEPIGSFAAKAKSRRSLRLVSYSITPAVGVPRILSDAIEARTTARCVAVQGASRYPGGLTFAGDVDAAADPVTAKARLAEADAVIAHNGRVAPAHRALLDGKPVLTLAHNVMWNVDRSYVDAGGPGLVVGQFPAAEPEFADWMPVPNPVPLWDPRFQPEKKAERITVVYTPADRRGAYDPRDRMFMWSKGYPETRRILDRLTARRDVELVVRDGRVLRHDEVLAAKRRAHIVIDECVTGGYHRNSLEGLATGCVVVNAMGARPDIVEAMRRCTAPEAPLPFVTATLDTLEQVLEDLVAQGPAALTEVGAANRRWMQRYWQFDDQWRRFWVPALDLALHGEDGRPATVVRRTAEWIDTGTGAVSNPVTPAPGDAAPPTPTPPMPEGSVTVVIPFGEPSGGPSRLPLLDRTLQWVTGADCVARVLVVEPGEQGHAQDVCRRHGAGHVAIPAEPGPFHKTRALNHGAGLAETSHVLFLDADLLLPPGFVRVALEEATTRGLDGLLPWRSLLFLSETDTRRVLTEHAEPSACAPLARFSSTGSNRAGAVLVRRGFLKTYGGMIEAFRGWGGEDNAFFVKLERLGQAGVTRRDGQVAYHLYHPLSALDRRAAAAANPCHARNVELLARVRARKSREDLLATFPPDGPHIPTEPGAA